MMENYELHIEAHPKRNYINGQFIKGHKPFNKGLPQKKWMDGRKRRRVLKYLEIGRQLGNAKYMHKFNSKQVVSIDNNGKLKAFKNSRYAEEYYKAKKIKINRRNISAVCHQKMTKNNRNGKYYPRYKAGGFRWFFADDIEKYKYLVK